MPPFVLEDFSDAHRAPAPTPEEIEAIRRSAYENGFQAGARDAIAAATEEQIRISSDLVATLQDMSFTFHEAAAHVMSGVAPVLEAMVQTVLPPLMAEAVGNTILDEIRPLAETAADIPVRILVSRSEADAVRHILAEGSPMPFVIAEDPALEPGKAHLRLGAIERQIDIASVIDRIRSAVAAVGEINERNIVNG